MGNFLVYIFFLDPSLFRTGHVQCMVVKTGIISCRRFSGLISVLFIRVNWYLKSFPLQWQGFFTLNYLGLWIAVLHVRRIKKRGGTSPCSHTADVWIFHLMQLLKSIIFLLCCAEFNLPCVKPHDTTNSYLLIKPLIRPICYHLIIFHFHHWAFSHTLSLCQ